MKKLFLFIMLSVTAMFTSCDKEKSQIVDSKVVSEGQTSTEDVKVVEDKDTATGATSTKFMYKTWLDMDIVRTRAVERIEVELEAIAYTEIKESPALGFVLDSFPKSVDIEHRFINSMQEDNSNVTVIDSALVFVVRYMDFQMEHVYKYQVAVYDDGVTRKVMPYKTFDEETFELSKGFNMEVMDCVEKEDGTYAKRLVTKESTINFDGASYKSTHGCYPIVLISDGSHPGVFLTELESKSIRVVDDALYPKIISSIVLKEYLSDGSVRSNEYDYEQILSTNSTDNVDKGVTCNTPPSTINAIFIELSDMISEEEYSHNEQYTYYQESHVVTGLFSNDLYSCQVYLNYGNRKIRTIDFEESFLDFKDISFSILKEEWKKEQLGSPSGYIPYYEYSANLAINFHISDDEFVSAKQMSYYSIWE